MGVLGKVVYFVWALLFENEVLYYAPRVKDTATDDSSVQREDLSALRQLNFEDKLQHMQRQIAQQRRGSKKPLKFVVRRQAVLEDAFRLVMGASRDALHCRLLVQWAGEEGVDQGGLAKEFFCILSRELFDCKYGLFELLSTGNGDMALHISPMATTLSDSHVWFRFSGRVLGLALLHSHLVDVRLAPALCKLLLRAPICLEDVKAQDVQLYRSLCWLRDNNIGAGHNLALTFAVTEQRSGGDVVEQELLPGGRNVLVTEHNKWQFLRLMMRWAMRVDGHHRQSLSALLYGFYEIIDWRHINMFTAHELSLLLSGSESDLNVGEWRRHTVYGGGYDNDHPVICCFWLAVERMDSEQRLRLLQFVTGSRQLPHGGFTALTKRFSIYNYGQTNELPRAHTCINRLYLPPYHDAQTLRDKLIYAVLECDSFGME